MNRLKLWLYMLVVLCAGVVNVYLLTLEGATRAIQETDAALEAGASAHRADERLMAGQAAAVAALAARDPALLEALAAGQRPEPRKDAKKRARPEPAADPAAEPLEAGARYAAAEAAARAAVEQAGAALSVQLPAAAFHVVATPEWLARSEAAQDGAQQEALAFLRDAAAGTPRRGYARVNDALWYGVALPAGQGAALVLFLPVDSTWASALKAASGCDVTIDGGTPQLLTTASPDLARRVVAAARATPGQPVGLGQLGDVQLTSPVRVKAPLLFAKPPALRAQATKLAGLDQAYVVFSRPTLTAFTALAHYQWVGLEVLAGLLAVGLLLGLIVKTEVLPQVPAPLVAAASKIERGEFSARAPAYLGALGTISNALNKAAEMAQLAQAPAPHVDPFAAPPAEPPEPQFDFSRPPAPAPAPLRAPPAAAPAPEPGPEARETTQRLDGAAPPAAAPRPPPAGAETGFASETFAARPVPRAPAPAMTAPGLTAVGMPSITAPASVPGPEEDEEAHWRAIHAEFLEVRQRCGESVDNLGFERFRPKLEKNKESLVQKYGCRGVRFSVYVKDGKAALKATPVR